MSLHFILLSGSDPDSYFEPQKRKLLILRDKSVEKAVTPLLIRTKSMGNTFFSYHNSFPIPGSDPSYPQTFFNIFETVADSVSHMSCFLTFHDTFH